MKTNFMLLSPKVIPEVVSVNTDANRLRRLSFLLLADCEYLTSAGVIEWSHLVTNRSAASGNLMLKS